MATVWIPALMRSLADGQESVHVADGTLREVIAAVEAKFPGMRARLCDGDVVRPGLSVVIDSQVSRAGLSESIGENSEVHFIPAIAGGQGSGVRSQESSFVSSDPFRIERMGLPPKHLTPDT